MFVYIAMMLQLKDAAVCYFIFSDLLSLKSKSSVLLDPQLRNIDTLFVMAEVSSHLWFTTLKSS